MTGRTAMRAKTDMTSQVILPGGNGARIANGTNSRPYYQDKGPALFR
jgi:hypothetical protein